MFNEGPIVDLINRRFDDLNHLVREIRLDLKSEIEKLENIIAEKNKRIQSLEQSRDKFNWTLAAISATASGLAVIAIKALDLLLKWSS